MSTSYLTVSLQDSFAQEGLTNLGLKDVKLALRWVQDNINSFRGDPAKVSLTIRLVLTPGHYSWTIGRSWLDGTDASLAGP